MEVAFLETIQDKLEEVTELKYIDEDWGQLDYYSPNFPVQWPCCLIDITGAMFSNIGNDRSVKPQNRQQGTINISFTFANLKLTNSSIKAPATQKNNAWKLYEIMQKAHEVLQGLRPVEQCGVLVRSGFRRIKRDDGVQQYQVIYTVGINNV